MVQIVSPQSVNPKLRDHVYRQRLFRAVPAWYGGLSWSRSFFRRMVTEFAGPNYGQQDDSKVKYIAKISQFINGHVMTLAGDDPQVAIETDYKHLMPFAKHASVNMNAMIRNIKMKEELQDWIKNAMILAGFLKCHYADSGHVVFENDIEADPGKIFFSSITIEDIVYDLSVKKEGRCRIMGDKYRMSISDLEKGLDLGMFEERAAMDVEATSKMEHDRERTELISNGHETDDDEIEPMFDAIDLFDFEDQVIRTYALNDTRTMTPKGTELATVEWNGIKAGPYHMLKFFTVPDNIMPKSPVGDIEALDRFINNLARKVARQAHNQKENLVYTPAGKQAGDALTTAKDRETIMVTSIQDVDVIRQGGVDASTSQTLANMLALIDEQGGNIKQMLGLGMSAETLGQEQMSAQAGSRVSNFMEDRISDKMIDVFANGFMLMWKDDFLEIESSITVDNLGPKPIRVDSSWKPGDRDGELWQYVCRLVPYSMRKRTPAEKVGVITQMIERIYLPLQQQMVAQGGMIDIFALNELFADNLNMPEFRNIVTFMSNATGGVPMPDMAGKPPTSNRHYTRHNVPSKTNQSAIDNWQSADSSQQPTSRRAMRA